MTADPSAAAGRPAAPRMQPVAGEELDESTAGLLDKLRGFRGEALNLFTTLARHPVVLRKWSALGSALIDRGDLPSQDRELLILRTAFNCNCHYEWLHHVLIGLEVGLAESQIAAAASRPMGDGDEPHPLLVAADELAATARLSDRTWLRLAAYSDKQLIEICMVVGHYQLTAGVINSLGVQADRMFDRVPRHLTFSEVFAEHRPTRTLP
jgi:4-carboxymuconolactone decarboxylase